MKVKDLVFHVLLICAAIMPAPCLTAQPVYEFAGGSGSVGNGSTIADQVVTFQNNLNNPSGFLFTPAVPALSATFHLSNQQDTLSVIQNLNRAGVSFGGQNSNTQTVATFPVFPQMNAISFAPDSVFSSTPTNIDTGVNVNVNQAVALYTSVMGLLNKGLPTNGRYYMADLTISFSSPVTNPVLQIVGLGGSAPNMGDSVDFVGFTTELELQTAGITLSKLSGSPELNVTATKMLNSALNPAPNTGVGAASGSILVRGTGITQLVFKLFLRGDGALPFWCPPSELSGDVFLIGLSSLNTNVALPVTISAFNASAAGNSSLLQWTTAKEENSDHFEVDHSTDGVSWQPIGEVIAAHNSATPTNYQFLHRYPSPDNNYYRLKAIDLDNQFLYSAVKRVFFPHCSGVSIFPNPVINLVNITTTTRSPMTFTTVRAMNGRLLQQLQSIGEPAAQIDLSANPKGMYLLELTYADGTSEVEKIEKL